MRIFIQLAFMLTFTAITNPTLAQWIPQDSQYDVTQKTAQTTSQTPPKSTTLRDVIRSAEQGNDAALCALTNAAEDGNTAAQNWIGEAYSHPRHKFAALDPIEAVHWFKLAAEQGYELAQKNLAHAYIRGNGVEKDIPKAIAIYEKLAESDCSMMETLARDYAHGMGDIPFNYHRSLYWREKMYGPPRVCLSLETPIELANAYAFGRYGVQQDIEKGYFWALYSQELSKIHGRSLAGWKWVPDGLFDLPITKEQLEKVKQKLRGLTADIGFFRESAFPSKPNLFSQSIDFDTSPNPTCLKLKNAHTAFINSPEFIIYSHWNIKEDELKKIATLADDGNVDAQSALANYFDQIKRSKDLNIIQKFPTAQADAKKWMLMAAKSGKTNFQRRVLPLLLEDKDYDEFFLMANQLADNNRSDALFLLGLANFYGLGIEENTNHATEYFKKCYENADTAHDYNKCEHWVNAMKGSPSAQLQLAEEVSHYDLEDLKIEIPAFWTGCALRNSSENFSYKKRNGSTIIALEKWKTLTASMTPMQIATTEKRLAKCP